MQKKTTYSKSFIKQLNKRIEKRFRIKDYLNQYTTITKREIDYARKLLSLKMTIQPINDMILLYPDLMKEPIIAVPDYLQKESSSGIVLLSAVDEFETGWHVRWKEYTGIVVDDFILVDANDIIPAIIPYTKGDR